MQNYTFPYLYHCAVICFGLCCILHYNLLFYVSCMLRVLLNLLAHKLIEAVFLEYARLLRSLGLREGAALWASRAGTAGQQLMEELFQGEGAEAIAGEEAVELGQESNEWTQIQEVRKRTEIKSWSEPRGIIISTTREKSWWEESPKCEVIRTWQKSVSVVKTILLMFGMTRVCLCAYYTCMHLVTPREKHSFCHPNK